MREIERERGLPEREREIGRFKRASERREGLGREGGLPERDMNSGVCEREREKSGDLSERGRGERDVGREAGH